MTLKVLLALSHEVLCVFFSSVLLPLPPRPMGIPKTLMLPPALVVSFSLVSRVSAVEAPTLIS